ncbi:jg14628 [Pararge aegeria aegeria]|uniref:Jg14628 protein n=1 Tax=Pararge aegeria aegeria TaxID=348720 RepID=A0A8S4RVC6_9NEOP|nr:jg14628 [Pararge aegeria aegeria]
MRTNELAGHLSLAPEEPKSITNDNMMAFSYEHFNTLMTNGHVCSDLNTVHVFNDSDFQGLKSQVASMNNSGSDSGQNHERSDRFLPGAVARDPDQRPLRIPELKAPGNLARQY